MTINFRAMPDKVSRVAGPLIEFNQPVGIREIGKLIADEEFRYHASCLDEVKFLQLLIRRDGNFFQDYAFYLTAVAGESEQKELHSRYFDEQGPLTDSVFFADHLNHYLDGRVESLARFPVFLEQLGSKSQALIKQFGGRLHEDRRYAIVMLPYYFWNVTVNNDGTLIDPIDIEHSRTVTARTAHFSVPRMPKVSASSHASRKRLSNLTSGVWRKFHEAGRFKGMKEDESGPYIAARGGRTLRPRDAHLVPIA